MADPSVIRHDRNNLREWLHKWFGTNRGAHWTIAGSVAVIIFGSYLIYNVRYSNSTIATTVATAGRNPAPITPGPLTLKK
jgi:hypothetical protein